MEKPASILMFLIFIMLPVFISCGHLGNPAPPKVQLTTSEDKYYSCEKIAAEILDLQTKQINVQKQIDSQRAQNIVSGIGGWLVIVPFVFIDVTTQKNDSKYSYEKREENLRKMSAD